MKVVPILLSANLIMIIQNIFEKTLILTVKNVCQKRMNHEYDRHAEKCFGMKENRNKETLETFKGNARRLIESPKTERINGSYRYETPAYFYKDKNISKIVW